MCGWFKSKCTHADVYETLLKRWTDVESRVTRLEMNEEVIRNQARKIQRGKPAEELEYPGNAQGGLLRGTKVPK